MTFTGTENGILCFGRPVWDMVSAIQILAIVHLPIPRGPHLLGSMLFLFVFGPAVEDRLDASVSSPSICLAAAAGGMHMLAGGEQIYGYLVPPALGASGYRRSRVQ